MIRNYAVFYLLSKHIFFCYFRIFYVILFYFFLLVGRLSTPSALQQDINNSTDWIKIPYKYNRGIIHDGDFPHLSSPITSISPTIQYVEKTVISEMRNIFSEAGTVVFRKIGYEVTDELVRNVELTVVKEEKRMRRVILGFNCFSDEGNGALHQCNFRAPEHSG